VENALGSPYARRCAGAHTLDLRGALALSFFGGFDRRQDLGLVEQHRLIAWIGVHVAVESVFTIPWKLCSRSRGIRTIGSRGKSWGNNLQTDPVATDVEAARSQLIGCSVEHGNSDL
jgi:hypothetical protein